MTAEPWTPSAGQRAILRSTTVVVRAVHGDWAWVAYPPVSFDAEGFIVCTGHLSEPTPPPATERVPWYRAMGRRTPGGGLLGNIVQAYPIDGPGGMYVEYDLPELDTTGNPVRYMSDGAVEVLLERDPR